MDMASVLVRLSHVLQIVTIRPWQLEALQR